jgi:hypothetical protein
MRSVTAALSILAMCAAAQAAEPRSGTEPGARLERRMFIVANNPDGYGIDRCLANGERCGAAIAASFCRARDFSAASSFHRVDREDITGTIPTSGPTGICSGGQCRDFVAIECAR